MSTKRRGSAQQRCRNGDVMRAQNRAHVGEKIRTLS